jgi:hypothetical protein
MGAVVACKLRLRPVPAIGLVSALAAALAGCTCPPPAQLGKNDPVARSPKPIAAKMMPLPSARLDRKAPPVTEKAKAAIAAMMEKPASAEFGAIKRAVKNLRGEPLDTICGSVKGRVETPETCRFYMSSITTRRTLWMAAARWPTPCIGLFAIRTRHGI